MPRLHHALGMSVLAATALTGLAAGPASASTVPKSAEVTRALPFSCPVPGSIVGDPPATDAEVKSRDGADYPAGWAFPNGAQGYAAVAGLGEAFKRAGVIVAGYSGTWQWQYGSSGNQAAFSGSFAVPPGGGPTDPRVPLDVPAPTTTLAIGTNQAFVDGLGFVFRGTTTAGTPADFSFVEDGDGDPTALTVACTGPRTLISSVGAVTPPPTPPVTPVPPVPVSLSGSAKLTLTGSLAGSTAPRANVRGTLDRTGAFAGTTAISPSTSTMTALGLLPIRATFALTAVGSATGTSSSQGGFALNTTQDIAIKGASFLGLPVATGTCHTATPAAIALTSTTPGATLTTGGTASGSFTVGKLTGCSTFGSLFGTNGGRATLQVQLAPFPTQPPPPPSI